MKCGNSDTLRETTAHVAELGQRRPIVLLDQPDVSTSPVYQTRVEEVVAMISSLSNVHTHNKINNLKSVSYLSNHADRLYTYTSFLLPGNTRKLVESSVA